MDCENLYSLPATVKPQHYYIHLKPNIEKFTFAGKSKINISINKETDRIVLNSIDLKITNVSLTINDEVKVPKTILFDEKKEMVEFLFASKLEETDAILEMDFEGQLNENMKGMYRSKYFSHEDSKDERYCAVTQFEPTDARRCFPCWDEPAIKSRFDITLTIPQNRLGLSNMPIVSEEILDDNSKLIRFASSPIMSTYLVAIVVGEYDYVEGKSSDGIDIRVYTPVGKKEQGSFALEVTCKVLPYYKEYFQVEYPLPKMDLIAISDFAAGAMENWGLVTYRETLLLVDPENTSLIRKQDIALTVSHEKAHQWFGNLVTMKTWTYLWLNEGFASFIEFLCVDHLFPEYDIWTQFLTDMYTPALMADSLDNSHPIEVVVNNPAEIDEIFDEISYNKGASIIRMLYHYLGDDNFRKGMHLYLTKFKYANTVTEDLWECLEKASGKQVVNIMQGWVQQMGFPKVKVVSNVQEKNGCRLVIEQTKFTSNGKINDSFFWMIPISISTSKSSTIIETVLDKKKMEIFVEGVTEKDWIKLNPGTVGFYRTQYSPEMLEKFVPAIKSLTLSALDRLGLIDDLFALIQNGSNSTISGLKLIDAYRNETNFTVWSSIGSSLSKLKIVLSHTDGLCGKFDAFGRSLFGPLFAKIGWEAKENEIHTQTLLRSLVLNKLISHNCEETCKEAKRRFVLHKTGKQIIPADLRQACYRAVLQKADKETYEDMLNLYRSTDLHEEKDRISRALGSIQDVKLLKQVLDFAVSEEVRTQDSVFVIASVAINPIGRELSWNFFKDNCKILMERYCGGFLLTRLIKHLTENFASEEKAVEIENFFKENCFPGAERTILQSIETIRLNASWLERDAGEIKEFLNNY